MSKANSNRLRQQPAQASTWDTVLQQEVENGLTRERIVAAAMAIADDEGLAAVSIRKVAAQLGSSPMAFYHYVPSKRDLLNLMLDTSNAEFTWPATKLTDWRGALSHFGRESRRCLKRHPWAIELRAGDPEYGPECIRILESLLTTLSQFGLDVRTAIRIIGVLFVFVNGFVAAETAEVSASRSLKQRRSANQPLFSRAILATGKFPHVVRFVEMGAELPDDQAFERALNWILNGIASDLEVHACVEPTKRRKSA